MACIAAEHNTVVFFKEIYYLHSALFMNEDNRLL